MEYIDLRSDTVTKPTPEMREAIAKAEVGDDVYGEDPTVNKLQAMSAELTGQEAGLFVASGTMGNLAAMLAHCGRGDEVILGNKNHTFLFEAGGVSALAGVHSHQLQNQPDGSLRLEDLESAIRPDDAHFPVSRLICLENTHNRCGGTYQSVDYTQRAADFARQHGLKIHLDGARVFNAAAALGVPVRQLTQAMDSVTFCLSKGLGAPAGSVLCGSREFVRKAHRARKMLGGGMRQAGVLAAAGIIALEVMAPRLAADHVRARNLAEGLSELPGLRLLPGTPATNMVFLDLADELQVTAAAVAAKLKAVGVLVSSLSPRGFRLVTHYGIDDKAVELTVGAFEGVLAGAA